MPIPFGDYSMLVRSRGNTNKVDKTMFRGKIARQAEVAEQADALRSGRSELYAHVGSTPTFGIWFFDN
jgi:hypothetical protein